ncbi:hypothetical protein [Gelidibacter pelagius]|uniref:Uncharacterized protein n=1 Tax=Gelidibacter pelagius TaxID=2819985 RepID=A0ABS3SPP9_9FLAO|nr:hypothetical protein [Gelidibacter pelagius]MBO3097683.1 hypothetical protein [Gelidibacter pelagius]
MIIKKVNPGIYEIEVTVLEIVNGNTLIDQLTGWDNEYTTLKLKCTDCTVMVFNKDIKLFINISRGHTFKALVKEWKENIYNFKGFV